MVPTTQSSTIMKSLYQVHRSVESILIDKDLEYLFEEILVVINDVFLLKINQDLIIKNELGYKLICEEIDYIGDSLQTLF